MNDEIKEILDRLKYIVFNEIIDYGEELSLNECKLLLDYITNLQQENERLKEENKHIFANVNDDELLISNAMNYAEARDYKSRCEKINEILKESPDFNYSNDYTILKRKIEGILRGENNE